jgi:transcriptional regulator with XRE-family HTH domain
MSAQAAPRTGLTISPSYPHWGATTVVRTAAATDPETIGQRLARLRKEKGLTQVELAERLKINQSMMSDYERDVIRLHGELIVQLTQILGVSADELLGLKSEVKKNGSIKNRRLLRQVQALDKLSKRDQQALLRTIELFLSKAVSG